MHPTKRSRTGSEPISDPTRIYCRNKLQELFRDIFFRYSDVYKNGPDAEVVKKKEELTDEERDALAEAAMHFANELEDCVFEVYHEADLAGAKYK